MMGCLNHQKGISILEIVVATLVLSIGLLGAAVLQMRALAGNNSANFRSQAAIIADDLMERMRTNRAGVDDNNYLVDDSDNDVDCDVAPTDCSANFCNTPALVAAYDLYTVKCGDVIGGGVANQNLLTDVLPSGNFSITCNDRLTTDADPCTGGSSLVLTLNWTVNVKDTVGSTVADFTNPSYQVTFRP